MRRSDIIQMIFHTANCYSTLTTLPEREKGLAFAPTNIALIKYWGKRDTDINLPVTPSLSIALPDKGALTSVTLHDEAEDHIVLNGNDIAKDSRFALRTSQFLDLFRPEKKWHLKMDITMSVPVAAGLASSACGFASLVLALNDLFAWNLKKQDLSVLARLGSGSAARSLWNGFVEWHVGVQPNGLDSFADPIALEWSDLRVGILTMSTEEKNISSREAMQRTVDTSLLYPNWPKKVSQDLILMKQALQKKNFSLFGGIAESNALTMHATMLSSWPPICYFLPETIAAMQKIWQLRAEGLSLYFTEDAGPNLKLLFLEKDSDAVREHFPEIEVIKVFE